MKAQRRLGWREFLVSLVLMVLIWMAREWFGDRPPIVSWDESEGESEAVAIWFTQPVTPGRVDVALLEAIASAQSGIDMAVYDLDLETVAEALILAAERGVVVRLVTEAEHAGEAAIERVEAAGIPVIVDGDESLMHNKFVVIDEAQVWTGSWNLTANGTYRNDNNVVVVKSAELARAYRSEFEEMFEDRWFGSASPLAAAYLELQVEDVGLEVFFEPEGDARSQILTLLRGAQRSIHFLAFSFTDDEIAEAIIERSRAGLDVRGVVETRTIDDTGAEFAALQGAGVAVLLDGNAYMMHHKVMVIDDAVVVTGSYNFTRSAAERNDENVLILRSPEIAARYREEFERVYAIAEEVR